MTRSSPDIGPVPNTDREIWRGPDEGNGSFYADSIHVTAGGGIGIDCGGHVIVKPLRDWHALARLSAGSEDVSPVRLGIADRLEESFKDYVRIPVCGAYPALTTLEIDIIVDALRSPNAAQPSDGLSITSTEGK